MLQLQIRDERIRICHTVFEFVKLLFFVQFWAKLRVLNITEARYEIEFVMERFFDVFFSRILSDTRGWCCKGLMHILHHFLYASLANIFFFSPSSYFMFVKYFLSVSEC